jgi:hypothetical protein
MSGKVDQVVRYQFIDLWVCVFISNPALGWLQTKEVGEVDNR